MNDHRAKAGTYVRATDATSNNETAKTMGVGGVAHTLLALYDLLEERLPKQGICGAKFVTTNPDAAWRQVAKIMEERAEHYAAEAKANNEVALSRLADVERLTRERDAAVKEINRLRDNPVAREMKRQRDDLRDRVDELIRERGQAIERYKALRADVEAYGRDMPLLLTSGERAVIGWLLDRDDERGASDG